MEPAPEFEFPTLDRRREKDPEQDFPASVLIVDDDANYRRWLARLLDGLPLHVVEAEDGEEALAILDAVRIDLLLLDRNMPRMNGIETLAALRAREKASDVFAIMLTAWDSADVRIEALDRGFDDFLPKNASDPEIIAKINASRRIVARHRALNVEIRELYNLSIRDPLTGLFNRRYFDATCRMLLQSGIHAAALLVDLDNFKNVNDRWGHLAGDTVLRSVGEALMSTLRSEDLADAERVAARIEAAFAALTWESPQMPAGIHATIGVAATDDQAPDLAGLLAACDRDLYRRKWKARELKRKRRRQPHAL
jgi:PleD family two-component response regulator